MVNKEWLENFKEPLRICDRLKRLDGSDKQISDYLQGAADWEAARGLMDEWLTDEAGKSAIDREWWEALRKDLAARLPP